MFHRYSRPTVVLGVVVLALLLIVGGIFVMSDRSSAEPREDLNGQWVGESNPALQFEAVIDGDQIEIDLLLDDVRGLYWVGDLDINGQIEDGDTLYSKADMEQLDMSLFGSLSPNKTFQYSDGKIGFTFEIRGTVHQIELEEK